MMSTLFTLERWLIILLSFSYGLKNNIGLITTILFKSA